jgi:endoglucanase Acf2
MSIDRNSSLSILHIPLTWGMALLATTPLLGQVAVGAGSYTTTLPSGFSAPQSTIYKSYSGPTQTHKFWTAQNWVPLTGSSGYTMEPQPLTMQTASSGLALGYVGTIVNGGSYFYKSHVQDMILGVSGLNASSVNVSDYSDWAATLSWGSSLNITVGRGMPFVYATTSGTNITITFPTVPTVFSTSSNILGVTINGNNYALFGPSGATWTGAGTTTFSCTLPSGKLYFSLALLPSQAALATYTTYAYAFPTDTQATWTYNQSSSTVSTTYAVTTTAKEGSTSGTVMALYPHHYDSGASVNTSYTYASTRGTMKVTTGSSFTTTDTYTGVIPFQPPVGSYSATTMQAYLDTVTGSSNFTYGDTYGLGKQLARVAHVMPIAKALGTTASATSLSTLQSSLESKFNSWFTASGKTSDLFYYNSNWGTLIGYPASYGSDTSLNDHHFHYGYWIHAAAILGLFDPSWASTSNYGGMVNLLAGDIATTTRDGSTFPFLRYFDIYEGHSWASGTAPFGDGGNCESSSESMNAWAGLIIWATETGNTTLRDAAIYMYTTEANAIKHYWFNNGTTSTFPSGFAYTQVANLFDGKSDCGTWFGTAPEYEHGIEFLPFTGGSNYLGSDTAYCQKNMAEVLSMTGLSAINPSTTLWPDIMEMYEAFYDPSTALTQWNSTTTTFDGESKAHEYYWLTNMVALGAIDTTVTANTPLYAVYKTSSGSRTHVAYNTNTTSTTVTFSDGTVLTVPAGSLASDTTTVTTSTGSTTGTTTGTTTAPAAPTSLKATVASSSQINLSWTASTTSGVTYSVYRSTTSGFTPSSSTLITSGLSATSYSNTGLTASTTYYYVVAAVNTAGSAYSSQVSATTSSTTTISSVYINCGGSASGSYVADSYYSGGSTASTTSTINTSLLNLVPPQTVLKTNRWGACTYTVTGLTAGKAYTLGLYFVESYWTAAGKRKFNVAINGTSVLSNFDIFATAGAKNKATVQWFTATANSSGQIVIAFTAGSVDNPQINAIAIY